MFGGKPEIEKVRYVAVSNDATRVAKFLDGEIDILSNVPVRDVDRVRATPGYEVISKPSLRLIYLGLDTGREESPGIAGSPPKSIADAYWGLTQQDRGAWTFEIDLRPHNEEFFT